MKFSHVLTAATTLAAGAATSVALTRLAKVAATRMWWDAQLRLTLATIQGPDSYLEAWGAWQDGLSPDEKRIQLLMNAITNNTELGYQNRVLNRELVREVGKEMLSTEAGRAYWEQARGPREQTVTDRRTRVFLKLINAG